MKVAWKHIKEYKKRSIAIVLSIMLSVFLVVTIGSLSESARVLQVDDIIQNTGRNHVFYNGLGKAQIDKISKEKNVKEVANSFNYGTWKSNNGVNVDILAGEKKLLYMLDTEIIEGKYPTESNEIAIEGWVLDRLRLPHELNKNIKLSSKENGEKEFKLVGIIKNRLHSQSHDFRNAFIAFDKGKLAQDKESIETLVEFKEGVTYKNEAKKLGKAIGIKDESQIQLNKMLLDAMGEFEAVDWNLVRISLLLMLVGGIVIYSLYSISVLKRVQEYGMMRAICSTKKQIVYIILSEIFILYIVGASLGSLTGMLFTYVLKGSKMAIFITEAQYKLDTVVISKFSIGLAMLSALGSILLAGLRGGILANKVSPIEAINKATQDKNVEIKEKESFIERFMNVQNKVSYKNLKRNKKVLMFTIIAMAVGSTFFMARSFKEELHGRSREKLESIGDKSPWSEILLNLDMNEPMKNGYTKEQLDEIKKIPQVENVFYIQALYSKLKLDKEQLNETNGENYIKFMNEKGFYPEANLGDFYIEGDTKDSVMIRNVVTGLRDKDLEYLGKIFSILQNEKIDINRMKNEPVAVVYIPKTKENGAPYDEKAKGRYEPVLDIKNGDKIKVTIPKEGYAKGIDNMELLSEHKKYSSQYVDKEFTVIGIVDELPTQYRDQNVVAMPTIPYVLISENMFKELSGIDNSYRAVRINLEENISKENYKLVKEKSQELSEIFERTLFVDIYEFNKEQEKSSITDNLFQNAIAVILILISGLSIYNNINYNLISRTREHGIMKAIGLTKKQFRKMIEFEGIMYGSISAIFSCIVALIAEMGIFVYQVYLFPLYVFPIPTYTKGFFIDWKSFLIVIAINLSIGYIATIGPRRQVDKIEITDAIRSID